MQLESVWTTSVLFKSVLVLHCADSMTFLFSCYILQFDNLFLENTKTPMNDILEPLKADDVIIAFNSTELLHLDQRMTISDLVQTVKSVIARFNYKFYLI